MTRCALVRNRTAITEGLLYHNMSDGSSQKVQRRILLYMSRTCPGSYVNHCDRTGGANVEFEFAQGEGNEPFALYLKATQRIPGDRAVRLDYNNMHTRRLATDPKNIIDDGYLCRTCKGAESKTGNEIVICDGTCEAAAIPPTLCITSTGFGTAG